MEYSEYDQHFAQKSYNSPDETKMNLIGEYGKNYEVIETEKHKQAKNDYQGLVKAGTKTLVNLTFFGKLRDVSDGKHAFFDITPKYNSKALALLEKIKKEVVGDHGTLINPSSFSKKTSDSTKLPEGFSFIEEEDNAEDDGSVSLYVQSFIRPKFKSADDTAKLILLRKREKNPQLNQVQSPYYAVRIIFRSKIDEEFHLYPTIVNVRALMKN